MHDQAVKLKANPTRLFVNSELFLCAIDDACVFTTDAPRPSFDEDRLIRHIFISGMHDDIGAIDFDGDRGFHESDCAR